MGEKTEMILYPVAFGVEGITKGDAFTVTSTAEQMGCWVLN